MLSTGIGFGKVSPDSFCKASLYFNKSFVTDFSLPSASLAMSNGTITPKAISVAVVFNTFSN